MHGFINNDDIPQSVPIEMTTSGLQLFFSNLERDFGPNRPIDIEYSLAKVGNITIDGTDEDIKALADIKLALWVETEDGEKHKDLEYFIKDMSVAFTIVVDGETNQVHARINQMEMGVVELIGDSDVDANTISQVMSFVVDSARTPINNKVKE